MTDNQHLEGEIMYLSEYPANWTKAERDAYDHAAWEYARGFEPDHDTGLTSTHKPWKPSPNAYKFDGVPTVKLYVKD